MTTSINPDDLVPEAVIAAELGQFVKTLSVWRTQGRGPAFVKVGRKTFYRREDVAAWLGTRRRLPQTPAMRRAADAAA